MSAAPKKRSLFEQLKNVAERHPKIELVPDQPDDAREQYPTRSTGACGAERWLNGISVACELDVNHGGDHEQGGRTWRPRSRDAADIAKASS